MSCYKNYFKFLLIFFNIKNLIKRVLKFLLKVFFFLIKYILYGKNWYMFDVWVYIYCMYIVLIFLNICDLNFFIIVNIGIVGNWNKLINCNL